MGHNYVSKWWSKKRLPQNKISVGILNWESFEMFQDYALC